MGEKFIEFIMLGQIPGTSAFVGYRTAIVLSIVFLVTVFTYFVYAYRRKIRKIMHYMNNHIDLVTI
jgi:hypothetical protein